jgi:hypothetical protein
MTPDDAVYQSAERRIERVTILIAAIAVIAAAFLWSAKAAAGVAAGGALSWINYRWMKQGVGALARLSTAQAETQGSAGRGADADLPSEARVPPSVYLKFGGRYALLIVAAYAILRGFSLPAASLISGFFAVVAAVIVEMIGQLFRSGPPPRADS